MHIRNDVFPLAKIAKIEYDDFSEMSVNAMKVLVDTNVVLDVLCNRKEFVAELSFGDCEDAIRSVCAARVRAEYYILCDAFKLQFLISD